MVLIVMSSPICHVIYYPITILLVVTLIRACPVSVFECIWVHSSYFLRISTTIPAVYKIPNFQKLIGIGVTTSGNLVVQCLCLTENLDFTLDMKLCLSFSHQNFRIV